MNTHKTRGKVARCSDKLKQNVSRILEKTLVIYGIALLFHLLLLALNTASQFKLGYFIVVRRVSIYSIIQSNPLINPALLSTSLTLASTAILSRRRKPRDKALLLVIPILASCMLLGDKLALVACLSISLIIGFILSLSIREVYEGLLIGLIILVAASIVELLLAAANITPLGLSYLINDLQGLMQYLSPYLYSAILFLSIILVNVFLVKRPGASINAGKEDIRINEYYYPVVGSILALIVYVIPYTIMVNPKRLIPTTDIVVYVELLEQMKKTEDPLIAALTLRQGDRFLYMLILYYLQKLLGLDSWSISTISGLLWTPILVFSTWYMVRRTYGIEAAKYAALITPLSTQMLGFIYGGFQANHLNISLLLLSMGLIAENKLWKVFLGSTILALSATIHLWSWMQVAPAIMLWILIETLVRRNKANLTKLGLVIATSLIAVIIAYNVGAFNYIYRNNLLRIMERTMNLPLEAKLNGLLKSLLIYLWGSLNNPVLFVLCINGQAHRLRKLDHMPIDYLNALTLIGIYLLSPDITMVSRLILNVPVHVFAGITLENSGRKSNITIYLLLLFNALYMALNAPPK